MDPITGISAVGVGYLVLTRADMKKAEDTPQPILGTKDPVPKENVPVKPDVKKDVALVSGLVNGGQISGAVIGAIIGGQLGEWTAQSISQYNAPIAKSLAVPVFTAFGAISGGILGGIVMTYGVAAIFTGPAFAVVLVIAVAVYAVIVFAAIIEDGVRYNERMRYARMVVRLAAEGKYVAAIAKANEGASYGYKGLGWKLAPHAICWSKGSLCTTPILGWGGGQFGLEHDIIFPALAIGDIDGIFGKDGCEMLAQVNGSTCNVKEVWKKMISPQQATHATLVTKLGRKPKPAEWEEALDFYKDDTGASLRDYVRVADSFVKSLQPSYPWVPTYYFDRAWIPPFHFEPVVQTPAQQAQAAATQAAEEEAIENDAIEDKVARKTGR